MRIIILLLFLNISFFTKAQNADSIWIVNNYIKIEQYITMRDGVKLFTSIYMPKDPSEKHPILLRRTPYSCFPYGKGFRAYWNSHYFKYLREGYIMVIQDVRGKYMSEGEFVGIRPFNKNKKLNTDIDEASDTYDTVDWLVKNISHNNGKVGVYGISYPGFYATMAALSNHPAIKAVSSQAPKADGFLGDDEHHNGAFMLMDNYNFYSWFSQPRPQPTTIDAIETTYPTKDNYQFFLQTGALKNFNKKYLHDTISFWNEMMQHPNYDAWWKARDTRANCKNVQPAMLIVGGLFDAEDCFGAWNTYKSIEQQSTNTTNKIVIGPWYHGQWASKDGTHLGNIQFEMNTSKWYADSMEVPFFNYYLKGKGTIEQIKEANIFFTGANKWKQFAQWPPIDTKYKDLYLHSDKSLSWTAPIEYNQKISNIIYSEYVSDPTKPVPYAEQVHLERTREYMTDDQRFASRRPDVLTFQTSVLDKDITLAGPIIADLMVSTTGTDADFIVKLIDVFPDDFKYSDTDKYVMGGYQMLVRGEVMRGKFRNSFEIPAPFISNKITEVKYTMPDVAHTFKKGHSIMVQIQSSWFPLVDRNPQKFVDIYQCNDEDFQKATIRIYHSAQWNSKIALPVLSTTY